MTEPHDFEELVRRHQDVVCAVAFAVLRDRARSEEVAQEAFLLAWQQPSAPAGVGWICGIARNLARNAARRKKESAMPAEHAAVPSSDPTPLAAVLDHEADDLAARALATLPEDDREIVVLHCRGSSHDEVAAALGLTSAAVRKRFERARSRLRSSFANVEASLAASRPGPAFTAGCVVALAGIGAAATAGTASAAAATTASAPVGGGGLAAIHLAGAGATPAGPAKPGVGSSPAHGGAKIAVSIAAVGALAGVVAIATSVASPTATSSASAAPPAPSAERVAAPAKSAGSAFLRKIDRDQHDLLADRIARVHAVSASGSGSSGSSSSEAAPPRFPSKIYEFAGDALDSVTTPPPPPADLRKLSKTNLRYLIRQIQPLLLECYRAAPRPAPQTGESIDVSLRIASEPDIGAVIESADVSGTAAALRDPELVECMRETLLSIELTAYDEAVTVFVSYPFTLPSR